MASKEVKRLFLEVLKNGYSIARAAEAVGMTRSRRSICVTRSRFRG